MIAYLKGTLVSFTPIQAIVDVQGVGYLAFIPCSLLGQLPPLGEPIQLYTTLVIREFAHSLYGFLNPFERDLFEILLNITGIGPKIALSIVGHLPLNALKSAIAHQDLLTLCKVPGIGKKTAERLLIELRDKLSLIDPMDSSNLQFKTAHTILTQQVNDAMLALINLGYNQHTAQKAIKDSLKELDEPHDLAVLITVALTKI